MAIRAELYELEKEAFVWRSGWGDDFEENYDKQLHEMLRVLKTLPGVSAADVDDFARTVRQTFNDGIALNATFSADIAGRYIGSLSNEKKSWRD